MATGFNPKENGENDLIGNILSDENAQDFFNLRLSMGRSISAPPPGLTETLTSSTPDMTKNEPNDPTSTKEYYYYYHSLKPHDPRLPKPKWKPAFYDHEHLAAPNIIQEGNSESGGTNPDDSGVDEFSSQFDQSMTLNTTKDTLPKDIHQQDNNKGYYGDNNSRNMHQNQNRGYDNSYRGNQNNNYERKPGHQNNTYHNQNRQHGYNQQRNQGQNQNYGHSHPQGHAHGHQMNPNAHPQGQFYPQEQQMGNFYGGNFAAPQMQPQAYYGMAPYQPQVFNPYGVDPNMAPNMNPMGKFQQPYPYMAGNNMGQVNPMNPMYMNGNPYMNNYYPMGMQPTMPNAFPNNAPQNQQPYGNKGQKPMNKPNYQKLDIKNVLANLLENCRDQNGSRLIQQHFEKADETEREEMFAEIIPEASELMTDVFGNYVIQKMLELGTTQQRQTIFEALKDNVFTLSQNTYGCRVIQKILEEFRKTPYVQDTILSEISQNILFLIEDQNGNHVIQKCFETVPIDKLQFIINEVTNNIDKLAFHAYGCRVIQKILETAPEDRVEPMLRKLMGNAMACCQCQYGNYIMQHILEKGPEAEKEMLLDVLKKNFTKLSMNKFASNVTEKSARFASQEFKHEVIHILLTSYYDNKIGLVVLMTHPYGNYVAQRLFEYSDDKVKRKVFDRLRQENLEEIKKNSYGRHVMTFIEKWMETQQA